MAVVDTIRPSAIVCDTLRAASIEQQPDGGVLLRIEQQLERALYLEVNKVLEKLGGLDFTITSDTSNTEG